MMQNPPYEETLYELLTARGLSVTTAESCTGGLVAGTIINVAGASNIYREGFITYSNEAKQKYLGVSAETLRVHGAVSRECAEEMAKGAARAAGAEVSVVTTGIAGPDGGTPEKPVGLVYLGVFCAGRVLVRECRFEGSRQQIRSQAVKAALSLACEAVSDLTIS